MRNGILLAENTPTNIMRKFESNSIEEAFLVLSQKQGVDIITSKPVDLKKINSKPPLSDDAAPSITLNNTNFNLDKNTNDSTNYNDVQSYNKQNLFFSTRGKIKALMIKNFVQLFRQPS